MRPAQGPSKEKNEKGETKEKKETKETKETKEKKEKKETKEKTEAPRPPAEKTTNRKGGLHVGSSSLRLPVQRPRPPALGVHSLLPACCTPRRRGWFDGPPL